MRIETPAREFTSAAELRAGYEAARARLWGAPPVAQRWEPPKLVEPVPVEVVEPPPIAEVVPPPPARPDPLAGLTLEARMVHRIVAAHYGITISEIRGPGRRIKFITPRHVAMYICNRHFGMSLPVTARYTHRDHSTALYARNEIEHRMALSPAFADEVLALVALCRSSVE